MKLTAPTVLWKIFFKRCIRDVHFLATGAARGALFVSYRHNFLVFLHAFESFIYTVEVQWLEHRWLVYHD